MFHSRIFRLLPIDSSANAVILSDVGSYSIEGNSRGFFSLIFKRHKVVHILHPGGYSEASVNIPLFFDGNMEEELEKIKAVTYNLENGKIIQSKLSKDNIFNERVDKTKMIKKFTMPLAREGSIVEYEYQIKSDFLGKPDPWFFQSTSFPQLWSEFSFSVPEFFSYNVTTSGYQPMFLKEQKNKTEDFVVHDSKIAGAPIERYQITAGVSDFKWAMKNIPSLKEESFTSSIKNHISRIELELMAQNPPLSKHNYQAKWDEVTRELLHSDKFGMALDNNNVWLGDELKPFISDAKDNLQKATKIHAYLRDNFACRGSKESVYIDQPLKNVFKTKTGTATEINLLLIAMLRFADIDGNPVIISTKDHGYALKESPLVSKFNYVVVQADIDGKRTYLDASNKMLGFNKLLPKCYNGHARVVNEAATPLFLSADSLLEEEESVLKIKRNPQGKWVGQMEQTLGCYTSYHIRELIQQKGQEGVLEELKNSLGRDLKPTNLKIDFLNDYNKCLKIYCDFEVNADEKETMYFQGLFNSHKTNPFISTARFYPVEMPYKTNHTFKTEIEIPKGFYIDELPKSINEQLGAGGGYFEYEVTSSADKILLNSIITIDKTFFRPNEYKSLRDFFALIISKQNEPLILKKKT